MINLFFHFNQEQLKINSTSKQLTYFFPFKLSAHLNSQLIYICRAAIFTAGSRYIAHRSYTSAETPIHASGMTKICE